MSLGTRSRVLSLTEAEELEDHSYKSVEDIRSRERIVNGPAFEFRMHKVLESLAALIPHKSAGYDKISLKLLRVASNELATLLGPLHMGLVDWAGLLIGTNFALGSYKKFQPSL